MKTKLKKYAIGLIDSLIAFIFVGILYIPAYAFLIAIMDDIKITSYTLVTNLTIFFMLGIYLYIYKIYLAHKQKKDTETIFYLYATLVHTILVFSAYVFVLLIKLPFVYMKDVINSYLFCSLLFAGVFSLYISIRDDEPKK